MIKKLLLASLIFSTYVLADSDHQRSNGTNQQTEDEEIIGGIGGTGLHDMERPELLERPELDIDSVLDSAIDTDVDMSPEVDTEIPE